VTLLMAPRPEVNALRGMIGVGFAIIVAKLVLRYFNIDWPPRRTIAGMSRGARFTEYP
jgi:hypothetical protein